MKAKVVRIASTVWFPGCPVNDPAWVGHMASTHMRPCNCWVCTGEHKYDRRSAARSVRRELECI